jgi:hypothetical protein
MTIGVGAKTTCSCSSLVNVRGPTGDVIKHAVADRKLTLDSRHIRHFIKHMNVVQRLDSNN